MRGAKELHGKRVQLLVDVRTKGGVQFRAGDRGTFKKTGVVRCLFTTDDKRQLQAGYMSRGDFAVLG